jgi:hypothetical protein
MFVVHLPNLSITSLFNLIPIYFTNSARSGHHPHSGYRTLQDDGIMQQHEQSVGLLDLSAGRTLQAHG